MQALIDKKRKLNEYGASDAAHDSSAPGKRAIEGQLGMQGHQQGQQAQQVPRECFITGGAGGAKGGHGLASGSIPALECLAKATHPGPLSRCPKYSIPL